MHFSQPGHECREATRRGTRRPQSGVAFEQRRILEKEARNQLSVRGREGGGRETAERMPHDQRRTRDAGAHEIGDIGRVVDGPITLGMRGLAVASEICDGDRLLARARVAMVFVDPATSRPQAPPAEVRERLLAAPGL